MKRRIRLALAGAGAMGRHHLSVARANPDFEIVGVADPFPAALDRYRQADIPVFGEPRDMLEAAKPDAVIVATPNATHVPLALACVERGIATLVEKPVSDSLASAAALRKAVEKTGVPVLVGHHRRHNPLLKRAAAHISGGGIGKIVAATGLWLRRKHDAYFADRWKLDASAGGGVLLINTIHDFDCLRMLCGDIVSIQAMTSAAIRGAAVEDTAAIAIRFSCGALGTIAVSDATVSPWSWEMTAQEDPRFATQPENCYLVCGTAGSLSVPTLETWTNEPDATRESPFTRRRLHYIPAESIVEQMAHFARVVRREEVPLVGVADAAQTLAATLAVRLSAGSGREIRLAEIAS